MKSAQTAAICATTPAQASACGLHRWPGNLRIRSPLPIVQMPRPSVQRPASAQMASEPAHPGGDPVGDPVGAASGTRPRWRNPPATQEHGQRQHTPTGCPTGSPPRLLRSPRKWEPPGRLRQGLRQALQQGDRLRGEAARRKGDGLSRRPLWEPLSALPRRPRDTHLGGNPVGDTVAVGPRPRPRWRNPPGTHEGGQRQHTPTGSPTRSPPRFPPKVGATGATPTGSPTGSPPRRQTALAGAQMPWESAHRGPRPRDGRRSAQRVAHSPACAARLAFCTDGGSSAQCRPATGPRAARGPRAPAASPRCDGHNLLARPGLLDEAGARPPCAADACLGGPADGKIRVWLRSDTPGPGPEGTEVLSGPRDLWVAKEVPCTFLPKCGQRTW